MLLYAYLFIDVFDWCFPIIIYEIIDFAVTFHKTSIVAAIFHVLSRNVSHANISNLLCWNI